MGITIYYKGKLNDVSTVGTLSDELEDFAQSLGWRTQRWHGDWSKPNPPRISTRKERIRTAGHVPLQGITLFPHINCEPLSFTFEPNGYLVDVRGVATMAGGKMRPEGSWMSTKTQFALIETHITIVKLLQHLKKRYITDMEVYDDGGYWATGDVHELKRRLDSINRSLDLLESALSSTQFEHPEAMSAEELAEMIEKILKKKLR